MGADPLALLWEATLAGSAAALLVLALRKPLRARAGASAAYALWLCVPVALLAVLLPRGVDVPLALPVAWQVAPVVAVAAVPQLQPGWHWHEWLLVAWSAGALASAVVLGWQQWRFRVGLGALQRRDDGLYQSSSAISGLPAVAGVVRPRILLPADFEQRYTAQEQVLVIAHERLHVRRGDLVANALSALLACLFWFNPLLRFALRRFRFDQELACDERVIARHPQARRAYGEAMLKTQFDPSPLPLGCHWQARHPLKERIDMLRRPTPTPLRRISTMLLVIGFSASAGYAAWAAQPASPSTVAGAPAVQDGLFLLARQNSYEGSAGNGVLQQWVKAGEPAVSIVGAGDGRWKNTAVVEAGKQPGTVMVKMRIERGDPGAVVAEPVLVVRDGEIAAIEQRDSNQVIYRSQLAVLPLRESRDATEARMHELLAKATNAGAPPPHTRMPPPRYPAEAIRQGVNGSVMLLVTVGADGSVRDVEVEKSTPPGVFDAAAVEAARQWRLAPEVRDGQPVDGARIRVPVTFESGMTPAAAPSGIDHAEEFDWFSLQADKVSESVCDAVSVDEHAADGRIRCGIRRKPVDR